MAGGVVQTRPNCALVNVRLAIDALVGGVGTVTGVQVDPIHALATIETGSGGAVINVDLTVAAGVAVLAVAGIVVDPFHTGGLVKAGVLCTLVNVVLTVRPCNRYPILHY